jgi:hypothetical protein
MNYVVAVLQNTSFLDLLPWGVGLTIFGLAIGFLIIAVPHMVPFGSTLPARRENDFR